MLVRHETNSAALVRRRLTQELTACGVAADSVDEIVLVASELVSNAVRHTTAEQAVRLGVTWELDATGVLVQVSDPSRTPPRKRTPNDDEPGGRGLRIIEAVADDWGVHLLPDGKQVWAHVPATRVAAAAR